MHGRRGFTLVEVMISLVLAMMLMGGILTSLAYLSKANVAVENYAQMNGQQRRLLEQFGRDIRQMTAVTGYSGTSFSGTVPASSGTGTSVIKYTYDTRNGTLTRSIDGASTTLLTDVKTLKFDFYNLSGTQLTSSGTSSDIKQVRLSATCSEKVLTTSTSNKIVSAKFTIRAT